MDSNDLRSLITVLAVIMFSGIIWWAYSDRRKADFDEAARLPLDDDSPLVPGPRANSSGSDSTLERKSS